MGLCRWNLYLLLHKHTNLTIHPMANLLRPRSRLPIRLGMRIGVVRWVQHRRRLPMDHRNLVRPHNRRICPTKEELLLLLHIHTPINNLSILPIRFILRPSSLRPSHNNSMLPISPRMVPTKAIHKATRRAPTGTPKAIHKAPMVVIRSTHSHHPKSILGRMAVEAL